MIFYTCTPIECYISSSKEGKCIFTVYFVKPVLNQELLTVIPYNSNERFPSFSNHPLSLSVRWPINVNDIFKEYLHIQSITKILPPTQEPLFMGPCFSQFLNKQKHVLKFSVRYTGADDTLAEYQYNNFNNVDLKYQLLHSGDHEFYNLQSSFSREVTHQV